MQGYQSGDWAVLIKRLPRVRFSPPVPYFKKKDVTLMFNQITKTMPVSNCYSLAALSWCVLGGYKHMPQRIREMEVCKS